MDAWTLDAIARAESLLRHTEGARHPRIVAAREAVQAAVREARRPELWHMAVLNRVICGAFVA